MKLHKLPNVSVQTCSAEQKLAYDLTVVYADVYAPLWRKARSETEKQSVLDEAVDAMVCRYITSYRFSAGKRDINALRAALRNGLPRHFDHPEYLYEYDAIGRRFRIK